MSAMDGPVRAVLLALLLIFSLFAVCAGVLSRPHRARPGDGGRASEGRRRGGGLSVFLVLLGLCVAALTLAWYFGLIFI